MSNIKVKEKEIKKVDAEQLKLDFFELDPLLDKNFSNTLEIYDIAGKFVYDKHTKFFHKASADEMAFTRSLPYNGIDIKVTITAANIERTTKDGKKERIFVFPGAREETIEDVLRKLSTERRGEAYQATTGVNEGTTFIGISFTIYEVYKELKRIGKTYSYSEIKEALDIMNNANLSFESEDGSFDLKAPYFPIVAIADKDKKTARSVVCFHPMVTDVVTTLNFRRYNYLQSHSFKNNYTRLIFKRLCHRWIQASESPKKSYKILLSTLIDAMKTPYKNLYQDKALLEKVVKELVEDEVITDAEFEPKKEGKKITDWLISFHATDKFAKQMAANNKVANAIKDKSSKLEAITF